MSLRARHVVDLVSDAGAVVNSRWFRRGNTRVTVQVVTSPANIVEIEGNSGLGGNAIDMTWEGPAGIAAMAALVVGIYEVRERPEFLRVHLPIDGAGPQAFRVILTFDVEAI